VGFFILSPAIQKRFYIGLSRGYTCSPAKISLDFVSLLRCQIGTLEKGKYSKYLPFAFTQEGVAMLSSVLSSQRAVQVNIQIMRAFVKLRDILSRNKELSYKLKELEERIEGHDADIRDIFEAIRQLMRLPDERKRIIGFASK
jgi:hypothetical protein